MAEKELKVILLGESGVGKTSIILRYYKKLFNPNLTPTFRASFIIKKLVKDNITYKLNIWDTTGQEKYHSVTKLFINGSHIVILVYAINNVDSFKKLDYWYNVIKNNSSENVILAIVGSKCDLFNSIDEKEIFVPDDEAENYAKEKNAIFKLVSAKEDNKGIVSLFDEVMNELIKRSIKISEHKEEKKNVKIEDKKKKNHNKKKGCC